MSTRDDIRKEIYALTSAMIEIGLCVDQSYPSEKTFAGLDGSVTELTVSGADEISVALRDRPYGEIYGSMKEKRAFNMLLIDGALVQFRYRFRGDVLIKHILAFYPSPSLREFQNNPELYELDLLYADIIRKDVVTTPIRFDFDETAFKEAVHPKAHFTIGQYKNCRVPVLSALTPYRFLRFVLRAFYSTAFYEYCADWKGSACDFPVSVTDRERAELHLSFV